MSKNRFPPGCDEERVKRVVSHYESQTEVSFSKRRADCAPPLIADVGHRWHGSGGA
jgi:hypothetical protein